MLLNRTIKSLSSLIFLLIFSAGQVLANPIKSARTVAAMNTPLRDIVLVIDTSVNMAYETDPNGDPYTADAGDDPSVCNLNNICQPMKAVKDAALSFLDALDFPNDRVAVITMTSQISGGDRHPIEILPLTANKADVISALDGIRVYEPRDCDGSDTEGACLLYDVSGTYMGAHCQIYENHAGEAIADPSSCPSNNIGGALELTWNAFTATNRTDALWMIVPLLSSPANAALFMVGIVTPTPSPLPSTLTNATGITESYNGFCPPYTYLWDGPFCRDRKPSVRHHANDPLVPYTNPISGVTTNISYYDADDFARDMADNVIGGRLDGEITIHAIGLGPQIRSTSTVDVGELPAGEALLKYIAECAGEGSFDDCATPVTNPQFKHGQYYYSQDSLFLVDIFQAIANYGSRYTGIYYVKPIASGTANCQSWENACSLQSALATAVSGDEIWVAAGIHKPTTGTDRAATFRLKNGVNTYGGFSGIETVREQRNSAVNVTILSGDLNGDDAGFANNSENVYHVVTAADDMILDGYDLILDGFTITAGNANGYYLDGQGGGIATNNGNLTLTNNSISGNSAFFGGGMYNSDSNPILINNTFSGNSATYGGGGIANTQSSSPTLMNVTFSDNSTANAGGGMFNSNFSVPKLTNVTFSNNSAANVGGGMFNEGFSNPQIRNTIFWENTAPIDGAQIFNDNSNFGSSELFNSVMQGGCPAFSFCSNIIATDPKLGVLGNYGGFTQTIPLLPTSSAINTGDDGTCTTTDQRGIARPQGAHCD
nr:hypothetical protein [Nitrosomonas sp.]